jgi:hypothetical protein
MRKSIMACSALFIAGAASAGELPKEGKITGGTYYAAGTIKRVAMGKNAGTIAWEENGFGLGGILDHTSWHCAGTWFDADGKSGWVGNCVGIDPAGDQFMTRTENTDENAPSDAKIRKGKATFLSGTGKFAGITGGWTFDNHFPEFKAPIENVYLVMTDNVDGWYKLP